MGACWLSISELAKRYDAPVWEDKKWVTVYQKNEILLTNGWVNFPLVTPFDYNGVDNLLVDFSFNNEAFTADGWLRTGDLGELTADGRLRMIGRLKDVFRVGGENVAPAEVEEVLLAHPAVETAQVVGVPDARLGEVPCAYVTLKDGKSAEAQQLIDWCKARCANFRVPRYLRIVADFEAIGMTASGKVQKTKLREHALREFKL